MSISNPYRAIIEHFPEGIVFLYEDTDELRYTFVGGEGLSEIGLTKDDLEGDIVAADRPPEIREQIHSQYRKALNGEAVTFEIEAEGRHFRFRLRPVCDESGAITSGVGIAQDITEQVVYREELERTNERLEQLTELVFHDIRNPLNVAQGRLDLLREEVDSEHIKALAQALDRIESLTSRETTLIEEPDRETFDTIDLHTIVTTAWRNVATKSAELHAAIDQEVRGDPDDLRRMFENLFRNAVEHGGEDVTVTVGDLGTGFYVEDDGTGIPPENRKPVFERGVSDSEQGTGLGLFIVKNVVETHGWEITVTESEEGGARFEITGVETPR